MVKKLVLKIGNSYPYPNIEEIEQQYGLGSCFNNKTSLLSLNNSMLEIVTKYKDKITEYYKNRLWDKYKKISNEYEHVFYSPNASSNISLYNPVSRSFFKLWEMLYDFSDDIGVDKKESMKCVFLAEGPGGFYEAFHKRRMEVFGEGIPLPDKYYGITLKSNKNKNIPDWKIKDVNISYGKDGTGNLYLLENIMYFVNEVGPNTVDFITADGGFDFSSDFNNQEEQSFRLIACEVFTALNLQCQGGSFLLKVYDCFNDETLSILQVLQSAYKTMYIIKPLTSRPANSERYILCNGFKGLKNTKYLYELQYYIKHANKNRFIIDLTYDMLYNVVLYNIYYTIRQIFYIQRTINYINFFKKQTDDTVMNSLIDKHTNKSRKWCRKYGIPIEEVII